MTAAKFLSSSWLPRMSRHWTSGRPASIITENWRVKTARFLALTLRPSRPTDLGAAAASAFAFAGVIRVTMMRSRLSAATAASIVSAMRSPVTVSPPRVRPEYANVAISVLYFPCWPSQCVVRLPPRARPRQRCAPQAGAGHDADAAVDHFLQLVPVRGGAEGGLERDQPLVKQARQRLVAGLHAELLLPGLHHAVDLVDLVVANQIADRGRRHEDLERHDAPLPVAARQQRLTDDSFEHQR